MSFEVMVYVSGVIAMAGYLLCNFDKNKNEIDFDPWMVTVMITGLSLFWPIVFVLILVLQWQQHRNKQEK
jgi:hypothetical protein